MLSNIVFLKCNTINVDLESSTDLWCLVSRQSWDSINTVLDSWSRSRGLHCFGLDLGLEYTVFVSYLIDTFIETVWSQRTLYLCNFYQSWDHEIKLLLNCWQRCRTRNQGLAWTRIRLESRFWDSDLNLDLRPVDLDLTISKSEDLDSDLEKEDLDLPLWDLTTSLDDAFQWINEVVDISFSWSEKLGWQ